ncbi:MAG: GGDEF domain-containing protein [Burkholderiales bacterium]
MIPIGKSEDDATVVAKSLSVIGLQEGTRNRALLLVLSGPAVGQIFTIGPHASILGRGAGNEACIQDPEISRRHARIALTEGRFTIVDLDSANGTYVNGARVEAETPLQDPDRVQLGPLTVLKFSLLDPLEASVQQRLHDAIHTDVLTGARNRRYLETRLSDEFAYAKRHGRALCVMMLDIDNFKQINDRHGHPAGDIVLRKLAALLIKEARAEDVVVRYGGEEFLIVARDLKPAQGQRAAERLRARVEAQPVALRGGGQIPITVSIGVACLKPDTSGEPATLIACADAALYRAKQGGRNRVVCDAAPPKRRSRSRARR